MDELQARYDTNIIGALEEKRELTGERDSAREQVRALAVALENMGFRHGCEQGYECSTCEAAIAAAEEVVNDNDDSK